jgi:uncharacterized protein YkwD
MVNRSNNGAARWSITGTPALGSTLQAVLGLADPDGNGPFAYRWQSSSNGITWAPVGSNSPTHRITTGDEGKRLRLVLTYTDRKGNVETVTTPTVSVPTQPPLITLFLSSGTAVAEGGLGSLRYTFRRTGPTTGPLTVNYTVGGTATLGTDYSGIAATPFLKTVTFRAGSATATVAVTPTADTTVESPETVSLKLAASSGTILGTPSAVTGTIRNSPTIQGRFSSKGESARYPVDVVTGSILRVSLTTPQPAFFPMLELHSLDGKLLKRSIAYNGTSADLGMVDLVTGKAMLQVRTRSGATGPYTLNVSVLSREDIKNEVFRLTNEERRKAGRAPLIRNILLESAAQGHVDDMDASNRYLAHTGSKGSTTLERIRATGYKQAWVDLGDGMFRTIRSENAAAGQSSPSEVVRGWMNSSGHRTTILDPATKEIGIGFDVDQETGSTYWLQNFGYPWTTGMRPWI